MQLTSTEDTTGDLASPAALGNASGKLRSPVHTNDGRLRAAFEQHFDYVWRVLRRLGVHEAAVDDAAQQVFLTFSAKLAQVVPGKERAFLTGTAFRVASNQRRGERRSHERVDEEPIARAVDPAPNPEELLEAARRREWLDRALDRLPLDLRAVLVLCELEDLTAPEIAALLDIPEGTVKSRLRRARQSFLEAAEELRAELADRGEVTR
ncbi:MAG TPA: RNA polymerase sigma factor [Polyangiaceae bacterium]